LPVPVEGRDHWPRLSRSLRSIAEVVPVCTTRSRTLSISPRGRYPFPLGTLSISPRDRTRGNDRRLRRSAAGDASDSDTGDAPDSAAGNDSRADPDSQDNDAAEELSLDRFHEALEAEERPVATASEVARRLGTTQAAARDALAALVDRGDVDRLDVESDPIVFYPTDWGRLATRERVVAFPSRREIVVDRPTQFTRARLSQFAHLVDTTGTEPGTRGYLYRIRQEDVWAAPFEDADGLIASLRSVLPRRFDHLEDWIRDQWRRAHRFRLYTHEDGYVVLQAASESLMGNVADQHLDDDHLRAPISETEAWVNEDAVAAVKRALYDAGYPVEDDRDLDVGDPVDIDLTTDLRSYQETWVETFLDARSGVYVGPPGSGKTVAPSRPSRRSAARR